MFERISRSFSLARSSWDVLRRDKQLLLFPILSGIACLLVLVSFAVPTAIFRDSLFVLNDDGARRPVPAS